MLNNNLNTLHEQFQNNKIAIFLPSLDTENCYSPKIVKPQARLCAALLNIINTLITNKEYSYKIELSVFLHTNDKSKYLPPIIHPTDSMDGEPSNEQITMMYAEMILYSVYQRHGYSVFYNDNLDYLKFKTEGDDRSMYVKTLVMEVMLKVTHINEGLADEFIDFKKASLLNITRISLRQVNIH